MTIFFPPFRFRLPEAVYADNQDMLGEVFVPSVDTVSLSVDLSLPQIRRVGEI